MKPNFIIYPILLIALAFSWPVLSIGNTAPGINNNISISIYSWDPCVCNDDQSANGAEDGTFSEMITIAATGMQGNPAIGLGICVGVGSGLSGGTQFTDNGDGSYSLSFNHIDGVGYSIETLVDCASGAVMAGTPGVSFISNTCYYPVLSTTDIVICETTDLNSYVNITNDGVSNNPVDGSFNGALTFSLDGQTISPMVDPASYTPGVYTCEVYYTAGNEVGISPNLTSSGCSVVSTFLVTIGDSSACSCMITAVNAVPGLCDDGGTPTDPADDTFNLNLSVSAMKSCSNFALYQGATLLGTYAYDTAIQLPGFSADENEITLLVIDACDALCSQSVSIQAPPPCSDACLPEVMYETEGGDVYINDACYGVIMKSPDGSCYRLRVTDGGAWVSELVPCPE